jgi:hypothetical protein
MIVLIPLLVALIGLLMYALASNPKLVRIGEIMFFAGLFVFLFQLGPQWTTLFGEHR